MKKLILIIDLIIYSQFSFSQYESIFGNTSTSWNVLSKTPSSIGMDSIVVCCDTTINAKVYKRLDAYTYSQSYPSGKFNPEAYFVREDTNTGQAWFRYPSNAQIDTNEVQFLNMSLNLGDTMVFTSNASSIVDSVYYMSGKKVLRLSHFNTPYANCSEINNERFLLIEGIGFMNHMQLTLGVGYCSFLLCKRKDEVLVYQNTSTAYGGYCNSSLLGIEETELEKNITFYPNPSNSIIKIENKQLLKILSIRVMGVNGKLITAYNKSETSFDVSNYEKGIYFIIIETEKGTVYKKIIVN